MKKLEKKLNLILNKLIAVKDSYTVTWNNKTSKGSVSGITYETALKTSKFHSGKIIKEKN